MSKSANVNIRMDAELKQQAEMLFASLGLTMATAFNIFIRQSIQHNGLPFEVKVKTPNAETIAAMEEVIAGRNLTGPFHSVKELMASLKSDENV